MSVNGKTTAEMQDVATFTSLETEGLDNPWDFVDNPFDDSSNEDIWDIDPEMNNGYPMLADLQTGIDYDLNFIPVPEVILCNYPNPLNPMTTISFGSIAPVLCSSDTAEGGKGAKDTKLEIFNVKGQKIKQYSIADNQYSITWDGTDNSNQPVPSGVYLYGLKIDDRMVKTEKMLLIK